MDEEVRRGAAKVVTSSAFAVLIILIVFFPILTLTGIEGKYFKPMAQTLVFCIIGALLLSLTYVPMMASVFMVLLPSSPITTLRVSNILRISAKYCSTGAKFISSKQTKNGTVGNIFAFTKNLTNFVN